MSEEGIEVERSEEQIVNENGKKKKRIVAIIITAILLLIVSVATICILKYKAEHRYIPFEELDKEQIVFVKVFTDELITRVWAYDVSGRKYFYEFPPNDYERIENSYDEIINGEVTENYVTITKTEEMYENLLFTDIDEYKKVSNTIIYDSGVVKFYGVRYLENGDVESILLWTDSEYEGKIILDDPYAKEIREWLRTL